MRRVLIAAGLDALLILAFALLGRRSHAEGITLDGTLAVAAPFLAGAALGWCAARAWRRPDAVPVGVVVWVVCVAVGLVLRVTLTDGGAPAAFVIVASVTLGVLLVGWRVLARHAGVARAARAA